MIPKHLRTDVRTYVEGNNKINEYYYKYIVNTVITNAVGSISIVSISTLTAVGAIVVKTFRRHITGTACICTYVCGELVEVVVM